MSRSPLAIAYRNGRIDSAHYGSVAVADPDGTVLFAYDEPHYPAYLRSSVKMIQTLPVVLTGAAERFGLTDTELAICCASHTGAEYHLRAVEGILEKLGVDSESLRCGPHEPDDRRERNRLIRAGDEPSQLHNNCSGKHAGMLAACMAMNWPLENYLEERHPLQQMILELLAEYSDTPRHMIVTGTDGCSLPTCYLPLSSTATVLARFVAKAISNEAAPARIMSAVGSHPEMIHAHGGFDSELSRVLAGRGIAKRGAMAIHVVGMNTERFGPIGIAIKLEDGNSDVVPLAMMRTLRQLDVLGEEELDHLAAFDSMTLRNWRGIQIGHATSEFNIPGAPVRLDEPEAGPLA